MRKILLFILLYFFVAQHAAFAGDNLVITEVVDSYFSSADVMARGEGNCELAGTRTYTGGCIVEQLNQNGLNIFDIFLIEGNEHIRVEQIFSDQDTNYITNIDGNDVPTTMSEVNQGESIVTMNDLTLQIVLQQLFVR